MRGRTCIGLLCALAIPVGSASADAPAFTARYVVHPGDSLSALAQQFGVSLESLAAANNLHANQGLLIGAVLHVPRLASAAPSTAAFAITPVAKPARGASTWRGRYRVRAGDSLSVLARRFGVSLDVLTAANGLNPNDPLAVGVVLRVPVARARSLSPATHGATAWTAHYVIRAGDSLSALAARFGVSLAALAAANRLSVSAPLLEGAVLRVPAASVASSGAAAAGVPGRAGGSVWKGRYVVQAGDSLSALAARFGVSLAALAAANGLAASQPLLIGVVLHVPARVAKGSAPAAWSGSYVVRAGDTLSGIALRYGVTLAALAQANGLSLGNVLFAGARLRVPLRGPIQPNLDDILETDPYSSSSTGYDVSYPNCATAPPLAEQFAVIGLNGGRPFTANPCFASEWAAADTPRAVYINTGYGAPMFSRITSGCAALGEGQPLAPALQRAYAVGCSEAVAAENLLVGSAPQMIWLDVEAANTWSNDPSLNVATLSGILDEFLDESPQTEVGVYSTVSAWRHIAGDWSSLSVPEWVAPSSPDPFGCEAGFAAGPVWISQATDGTLDTDTAC